MVTRLHSFRRWPSAVHGVTILLVIILVMSWMLSDVSPAGFSPQKAGFAVKFKKEISPYRTTGVFALPREILALEVLDTLSENDYVLEASTGRVTKAATNQWTWQAPEQPGLYPVKINHLKSADWVLLNIFVMVPYNRLKGEYLNGYRIGRYPTIPFNRLQIYKPPKGFIEVTEENKDTLVAPHFRIGQFLSKQRGKYPKYVVLRERLLLKLELILEKVNAAGYRCDTLHIMSGYRTPYYNRRIGNVKYSRHVWGGAADIFIDENPKDKMMDDLNQDGKIDYQDASVIYDIIDRMYGKPFYERFVGGLGRYKKMQNHGPFVHVDVRGLRARWGD